LVGKGRALKMLLTGFTVKAGEAYSVGLVDEVVPEGQALAAAKRIAKRIEILSPLAVKTLKKLVTDGFDMEIEAAYQMELIAFKEILDSEDSKEGLKAFFERRVADYKGF
jgi:enoyl-CoA hydratase/carnithine racemase